jgi:hypothetical protein
MTVLTVVAAAVAVAALIAAAVEHHRANELADTLETVRELIAERGNQRPRRLAVAAHPIEEEPHDLIACTSCYAAPAPCRRPSDACHTRRTNPTAHRLRLRHACNHRRHGVAAPRPHASADATACHHRSGAKAAGHDWRLRPVATPVVGTNACRRRTRVQC